MMRKKWKLMYVYSYAGDNFCLFAKMKKNGIIKFRTTHFVPQWKFWTKTEYVPVPSMDIQKSFDELLKGRE